MAKKASRRSRYRSYRRRSMTKTGRPITLATWANGAHTAYALFFDTSTGKDNIGHLINAVKNQGAGTGAELGIVAQGVRELAVENGAKIAGGWIAQLAASWLAKKLHVSTVVGHYKNKPIRLV